MAFYWLQTGRVPKGHAGHGKQVSVGKSSADGGDTVRQTLEKSCSRLVSVIQNHGFVSKDCIVGEGFVHSFVETVGQTALGGRVNCNLMCIEDELPFLTSGLLLS